MVKVRIENNGKVVESEGDLVIGVAANFQEAVTEARVFLAGRVSGNRLVELLLSAIPRILESVSEDKADYIDSMLDLNMGLEKKFRSELKENADAVAEMIRKL